MLQAVQKLFHQLGLARILGHLDRLVPEGELVRVDGWWLALLASHVQEVLNLFFSDSVAVLAQFMHDALDHDHGDGVTATLFQHLSLEVVHPFDQRGVVRHGHAQQPPELIRAEALAGLHLGQIKVVAPLP
jgi:hypothetical protein